MGGISGLTDSMLMWQGEVTIEIIKKRPVRLLRVQ
jgi:hypothetical protein